MESVWDYPRPPRVERSAKRVRIVHAGVVLVDSDRCFRVLETSHPPVYYVPRAELAEGALVAAPGRSFCEFKGNASYWALSTGGGPVAWSYGRPSPGFEVLAGALAFYPERVDECALDGEPVRAQEGDFYGGSVTADITGPFKGGPGTSGW